MKETTIDGKTYVLKEDISKEYAKKAQGQKVEFRAPIIHLVDECGVMGMGSVELLGDWKKVCVSIEYLTKAIKIVEMMSFGKNSKRKTLVLAMAPDYPLCLGEIRDNKFSGVVIAPVIKDN